MSSPTKTRLGAASRKSPIYTGCYSKYGFVSVTYFSENIAIFPAACKIRVYTDEQSAK